MNCDFFISGLILGVGFISNSNLGKSACYQEPYVTSQSQYRKSE